MGPDRPAPRAAQLGATRVAIGIIFHLFLIGSADDTQRVPGTVFNEFTIKTYVVQLVCTMNVASSVHQLKD